MYMGDKDNNKKKEKGEKKCVELLRGQSPWKVIKTVCFEKVYLTIDCHFLINLFNCHSVQPYIYHFTMLFILVKVNG